MFVCLWNNKTKPKPTQLVKANSTKAKQGWFKPSIKTKPKQTSPNQSFSTMNSKLTASNMIKSKVPEKCARAAQLLYRPLLVVVGDSFICF